MSSPGKDMTGSQKISLSITRSATQIGIWSMNTESRKETITLSTKRSMLRSVNSKRETNSVALSLLVNTFNMYMNYIMNQSVHFGSRKLRKEGLVLCILMLPIKKPNIYVEYGEHQSLKH